MQADKELLEGMENAINSIFEEIEDVVMDEKSYYEMPVQDVFVNGHKCQVVTKLIIDPKLYLEENEVYWANRPDESGKEKVPSPLEDLDDEDDE